LGAVSAVEGETMSYSEKIITFGFLATLLAVLAVPAMMLLT
jgi:hypothetical protein